MDDKSKLVLPAIAVRGIVPLPNNEFRIEIGREPSVQALDAAESMYSNNILLLIQKNSQNDDITENDLQPIGVLAKILLKLRLPNNNYKVKFKVTDRINVLNYESVNPYFVCNYEKCITLSSSPEREAVLMKNVMEAFTKNYNNFVSSADEVLQTIRSGASADALSDIIAFRLRGDVDKYKYLSELDVCNRLKYLLEDFELNKELNDLEDKINQEVKKSIDQSQKEYYLREKMKAIQNELGDKARQDEEVEEFRKKIEESQMPERTKEKARQELSRYASTSNQMAESGIMRTYIETLVNLPWGNQASADNNDLKDVSMKLDSRHYGLEKVKERIVEYLAVKIMTNCNPHTILCFVGPPGVGKTSLGKSIADALGRKFIKQSLGGVRDEAEIRGHRRTYIGAMPGRIIKGMLEAKTVNPVFLLDEIDKMASDYRGDPAAAMLEVLDPEQNNNFSDNYLEEPYDLSQVMFITTANSLEDIPAPLRDRMEIIELSSYTEFEKFNIAYKHLLPRELKDHGLNDTQLKIEDEAMYEIIRNYTREAGVRELNRLIATICRKTVKDVLINKTETTIITKDNLTNYLGKARFFNNVSRSENQIGIVTGLAYTQFGGDTLDIEVTYYKGKGGLVLTGKLGDVMKESAQTALSYVKSHAAEYGIPMERFNENDIHIHVPEGAVPKDGPSAGVTLTTGIASALSGKPVDSHLGMTGEVTLRGQVLPIGGLREKSIAALRSGLKTILIPKDNERDLDDVPAEVKKALKIIPVANVSEVLDYAIIK